MVDGYIGRLNSIPPSRTTVTTFDDRAAIAGVDRLQAYLNSIPSLKTVTVRFDDRPASVGGR